MHIKIITAGALIAGALFSNASAMDGRQPTEVHVSTLGVDFARPAAVQAFYGRLRTAAHQACDSRRGRDLGATLADNKCATQALDRAVAEAKQPTLLALHTQQTGRSQTTLLAAN